MGQVLAFRRKQFPAPLGDAADLYAKLTGSVDIMWREGWADLGENGETVLYRRQHCIGLWMLGLTGFSFRPIETGEPMLRVETVEDAYRASLHLLGDPRPLVR